MIHLLLATATSTPRVGGVDEISIHVLETRDEIEDLAIFIDKMADDNPAWDFFRSDAVQVRDSDVVMILADRRSGHDLMDSDCNLCGYMLCNLMREAEKLPEEPSVAFAGPFCLLRSLNLAYALAHAGEVRDAEAELERILEQDPTEQAAAAMLEEIRAGRLPEKRRPVSRGKG